MLNEVKHLYNKDSSLTLRMTVSVIIYIVSFFICSYFCDCVRNDPIFSGASKAFGCMGPEGLS